MTLMPGKPDNWTPTPLSTRRTSILPSTPRQAPLRQKQGTGKEGPGALLVCTWCSLAGLLAEAVAVAMTMLAFSLPHLLERRQRSYRHAWFQQGHSEDWRRWSLGRRREGEGRNGNGPGPLLSSVPPTQIRPWSPSDYQTNRQVFIQSRSNTSNPFRIPCYRRSCMQSSLWEPSANCLVYRGTSRPGPTSPVGSVHRVYAQPRGAKQPRVSNR